MWNVSSSNIKSFTLLNMIWHKMFQTRRPFRLNDDKSKFWALYWLLYCPYLQTFRFRVSILPGTFPTPAVSCRKPTCTSVIRLSRKVTIHYIWSWYFSYTCSVFGYSRDLASRLQPPPRKRGSRSSHSCQKAYTAFRLTSYSVPLVSSRIRLPSVILSFSVTYVNFYVPPCRSFFVCKNQWSFTVLIGE